MTSITLRITASALVIGLAVSGCQKDDKTRPASLSADAPQGKKDAHGLYQEAQAEARKGDVSAARALMEKAVELSPKDAGYRMGLAELYMRSGRFVSAERTFADTVILNPENVQAALYLALTRGAQGKTAAAVESLEKIEDRAKPVDIGLAYALVGEFSRAIAILEPASHAQEADGRIRQNLALAYALSGDWTKARVVAAQDISPTELDRRMEKWAALSRPENKDMRVAAFLGVSPVADPGQPTRLALVVPEESVALAQAAPTEYTPPASEPPALPVREASASYFTPSASYAAPATSALAPAPAKEPAASLRGAYVVQLGAFSTRDKAEAAWKTAQRRYGLSGNREVITTVIGSGEKGVFHRLAVQGFGTAAEAGRTCRTIKAKGGDCFVRALGGSAGPTAKFASRR